MTRITARGGLMFDITRGSTDEKAIDEVVNRRMYLANGMSVDVGDRWLDLGANIGSFSVLAASEGAEVIAVEPHPENLSQLRRNIVLNGCRSVIVEPGAVVANNDSSALLYVCGSAANKYRHTLRPVRGRKVIEVPAVSFDSLLQRYHPTAIKMDIEGAEYEILDHGIFNGVRKMVMEYHFDRDSMVAPFYLRMQRLSSWFSRIEYRKMPLVGKYEHYPDAIIVRCWR